MSILKKDEKYIRRLEILHSIGRSISANLDVHTILQEVTDATTTLSGAAFGAFFYNNEDENGQGFTLYTLSGAPREAFEKFGVPRHTGVFHPTFVGGKVVRVGDITTDERYGNNSPHSGMPKGHLPVRSYLAVPVVSKTGDVIGGLLLGHPEAEKFEEEHEEIVVDIAAQAAISLDNSRLFEQVRDLSRKKDEFIALASHELKTPLTSVQGYLQVLQRMEQDSISKLFLEKAIGQVNRLNNLVNELLNLSRAESGRMEYNMELFDINTMISDTVENFCHTSKSHEVIFSSPQSSIMIYADQSRIEQVVTNFLSNAVKYSPGADKVEISIVDSDEDVTVKVRDYGQGLSRVQQNRIFERFYRAENSKGLGGLGLGLYLSKQIIDRHEGTIGVRSKPLDGSEFFFKLQKIKENKH